MILLDNVDIEVEFGLIAQPDHSNALLPSTRDSIITIGQKHGALDFGAYLEPKSFNIPLAFVKDYTDYDLQNRISQFARFLLDSYGKPKTMELIFKYDIDKVYKVRYSGHADIKRQLALGFFNLQLIAVDPFIYLKEYAEAYTLDSGIAIDNTISPDDKYRFDLVANTTVSVNNFGTMYIKPIIEITGSFTDLSITANGKTLVYSAPKTAGSNLVLDCELMTAKEDGLNVLKNVGGYFLDLLEGYNDVVVSGTDLNINIYFKFKPRFI